MGLFRKKENNLPPMERPLTKEQKEALAAQQNEPDRMTLHTRGRNYQEAGTQVVQRRPDGSGYDSVED